MHNPHCLFCEKGKSDGGLKWVEPVGRQGICDLCAASLRAALDKKEIEVD